MATCYINLIQFIIFLLIRFPEELSGAFCFGSTILRVIAGSGYKLYWAPQNAFVKSEKSAGNLRVDVTARTASSISEGKGEGGGEGEGEGEGEGDNCGCIHVKNREVMKKFIDTLQRSILITPAVRLLCCCSTRITCYSAVLYSSFLNLCEKMSHYSSYVIRTILMIISCVNELYSSFSPYPHHSLYDSLLTIFTHFFTFRYYLRAVRLRDEGIANANFRD